MRDEYGRINNKAQAIRSLDKLRMAHLLDDISGKPEKYPQNVNEWLDWLNKESGNDVRNL